MTVFTTLSFLLLTALLALTTVESFRLRSNPTALLRSSSLRMVTGASEGPLSSFFDGVREPVKAYLNSYVPTLQDLQTSGLLPEPLVHWGHPLAMGTVLLAMGGIGTYLGWQIRNGNGESTAWFTLGETARAQHPKIMLLASFFFLIGGQGGLLSTLVQGKEILNSAHATSAVLGLAALTLQATVPLFFKGNPKARTFHAFFGSSTMALLVVHAVQGVSLGLTL